MGQVTVTLTGDEARLLKSLDKVIAKEAQLKARAEKAGEASEKALNKSVAGADKLAGKLGNVDRAQKGAFGPGATAAIAGMASAIGAVAGAWASVSEAIAAADAARKRAAEGARGAESPLAQLAQLANGDQGKFNALIQEAKLTSVQSGVSLSEAAATVFQLESAGALGEIGFFRQLQSSRVVGDVPELAKAARTIQTAVGENETGSLQDLVSKGFAASKFSPATVEALLTGASRGGGAAKQLGVSDEELLSMTAVLATSTGSAEEGGTQAKSFLTALAKRGGFKGLDVGQSLDKINALPFKDDPAEMVKYFGRVEALNAYSALNENRGMLGQITSEVSAAPAAGLAQRIASMPEGVAALQGSRLQRSAVAMNELSQFESLATGRNLSEATLNVLEAEKRNAGQSEASIQFERSVLEFGRKFVGDSGVSTDAKAIERAIQLQTHSLRPVTVRDPGDAAE